MLLVAIAYVRVHNSATQYPRAPGAVLEENISGNAQGAKGWGMGRGFPPPQPTRGSGVAAKCDSNAA